MLYSTYNEMTHFIFFVLKKDWIKSEVVIDFNYMK